MIDKHMAKIYCRDDISLIENYEQAINDTINVWDCHHRLEIHSDYRNSKKELKMMNLYENRPAAELIFLKINEHRKLHRGHKKYSNKNYIGNHNNPKEGKPSSEFGEKFKEHYGITKRDNVKLYEQERSYYRRHNFKVSWEA